MLHSNFLVFSFPSIHHTCSALLSDSPLSFLGPISFSFECNRGMRAGTPSAGGCEELPHIRGQGQQPRVPGCDGAGTAERSYPASKVRGGSREELPGVRGQWRPGGATPRPRSVAAGRSHLSPEARDGDPEEPPTPEARGSVREEQPEDRWLRRHRRA